MIWLPKPGVSATQAKLVELQRGTFMRNARQVLPRRGIAGIKTTTDIDLPIKIKEVRNKTKTGTISLKPRYPAEIGNKMIKFISAIAVSAFIAVSLFVLPGFAPPLETGLALQKGDRLLGRVVGPDCSQQMWPNFSAACLHGRGEIRAIRLISARG